MLATDSTGLYPHNETKSKFLLLVIIQLFLSPFKNGRKIKGKFLPAGIQLLSRYTSGNIIVVACLKGLRFRQLSTLWTGFQQTWNTSASREVIRINSRSICTAIVGLFCSQLTLLNITIVSSITELFVGENCFNFNSG